MTKNRKQKKGQDDDEEDEETEEQKERSKEQYNLQFAVACNTSQVESLLADVDKGDAMQDWVVRRVAPCSNQPTTKIKANTTSMIFVYTTRLRRPGARVSRSAGIGHLHNFKGTSKF